MQNLNGIDCNGRWLNIQSAAVMGILNITPDSFSDGGVLLDNRVILNTAAKMLEDGCAIFDVGGESTRPGAADVAVEKEIERVVPVITQLAKNFDVPISVDTSKPEVMQVAVESGAGLINDVRALRAPGALEMAAQLSVPVCLMHMQGEPRTMQDNPQYSDDIMGEVISFFEKRITACIGAGIDEKNILLDPGFGFGKNLEHNLTIFRELPRLVALGFPVLIGVSRKSMIGEITGLDVGQRDTATAALSLLAAQFGAHIVRVHNVAASHQTLTMLKAVHGD